MYSNAGPYYALTDEEAKFVCGAYHHSAFDLLKCALASEQVWALYDRPKSLGVSAVFSAYRFGAVMFHFEPNNLRRPIYFA